MGLTLADVFVKIASDDSQLKSGLKSAESQTKSWVGSLGGMLQTGMGFAIGGAINAGINGLVNSFGSLTEGVLGGNAAFETYNQQFGVLLGSTELAKQRMGELADFANKTPFELPEVVQAAKIMETFGLTAPAATEHFESMGIDIQTLVGDMAAGVGVKYDEMAGILGRFNAGATGEAIQRMQELGLVTKEELAGMGVEFSKSGEMITPAKEALDTLLSITQERFGGMMEVQSKTFEGMSSTLSDWVSNAIREMGQPIFDRVKAGLEGLLEILSSDAASRAISGFTSVLENGLTLVESLFSGSLIDGVNGFVESLASGLEQVSGFLVQLRDEFLGLSAGEIMNEVGAAIDGIKDKLKGSLEELAAHHEVTVNKINNQIQVLAQKTGEQLAEIAQKYAEKALAVEERFSQVRQDIERSLAEAKDKLGEQLAQNEQQRQEKLVDLEKSFAEKRRAINEQIQDKTLALDESKQEIKDSLEEKQTSLTEKHEEKRAQLIADLAKATTDEEKAAIQAKIDAEDAAYKKQHDKNEAEAKKAENKLQAKYDREVQKLKDKLAREEQEYQSQVNKENQRAAQSEARIKQQYDKAVSDLQYRLGKEEEERTKQLAKIGAEQAAEEAKVRESNQRQLAELQARLDAENAAYEKQRQQLTEATNQEIARLQQQANERAAALGTGPAAQLAEMGKGIAAFFAPISEQLQQFGSWFMTTGVPALQAFATLILSEFIPALQGIAQRVVNEVIPALVAFVGPIIEQIVPGLQLLGQIMMNVAGMVLPLLIQWWNFLIDNINLVLPVLGVVGAAILAMTSPIALVIGAIVLLATAWANNWGGIQGKTQAVMDYLQPYWDKLTTLLGNFANALLPRLQEVWQTLVNSWQTELQPALAELWAAFGKLFEALGIGGGEIDWLNGIIGILEVALRGVLVMVELLSPMIELWSGVVSYAVSQVTLMVDGIASLKRGLDAVIAPLQRVADKIRDMINEALSMPDWLIPGSPTPFEMGLRGIGKAINQMPDLTGGMGGIQSALNNALALPELPSFSFAQAGGVAPMTVNFQPGAIVVNGGLSNQDTGTAVKEGVLDALRSRGLR